jgi:hypothetical protein
MRKWWESGIEKLGTELGFLWVSESWDRIYKGFVTEDFSRTFWRFNHDEKPS